MVEIKVHRLITDLEPSELSGSVAERGANAGPETWANSVAAATESPVLADDSEREAVREWAGEFGAWSDEEINGWSNEELDALVLQYAAGDLRELQSCHPGDGLGDVDWDGAEEDMREGRVSGNLFVHNDELWIMLE